MFTGAAHMKTDWNNVATWYDEYLKGDDTYQAQVIAPNLLRMLELTPKSTVLDLACGQGYFSRLCALSGAQVVGVDQSEALIAVAQKESTTAVEYIIGDATALTLEKTFTRIFSVLALENIQAVRDMVHGATALLEDDGKIVFVMLHPAFRIPKHSDWGFNEKKDVQYRIVEKYLSEVAIPIELHPFRGSVKTETVTFHRSLQWYMKTFRSAGLAVTNIEEWISHKTSEKGARQRAEDKARREIPMFLAIELKKVA
jgi:2-polyprenyl-3-methyl-5-hydroxy-6-metoxy-1,4-benzoquinol methylase